MLGVQESSTNKKITNITTRDTITTVKNQGQELSLPLVLLTTLQRTNTMSNVNSSTNTNTNIINTFGCMIE